VFVISKAKLKFIQEYTGQRRPARFIQLFARYAHQSSFGKRLSGVGGLEGERMGGWEGKAG